MSPSQVTLKLKFSNPLPLLSSESTEGIGNFLKKDYGVLEMKKGTNPTRKSLPPTHILFYEPGKRRISLEMNFKGSCENFSQFI